MTEQLFELRIEPSSEKFGPNDSNWMGQVEALYSDLQLEVGKVGKRVEPVEGHKGGMGAIILALGSAGAFTAAVQMFQAWLGRDRTRGLTLSILKDGKEHTVSVSGTGMDEAAIKDLMEAGLSSGE